MPRKWNRRRRGIPVRTEVVKGSGRMAREVLELAPWEEAVGKLRQSGVDDGEIMLLMEMGGREVKVAVPCHSYVGGLPSCGKTVGVLRTDAGYCIRVVA